MKILIISLGCDKNKVDTENLIGYLAEDGHIIVNEYSEADIIIVNSCAFLQSAVKESVDTVFEAAGASDAKIILTGCLPQRYMDEISGENGLSEVDAFVSNQHYHRINEIIQQVVDGERLILHNASGSGVIPSVSRILTTPLHYAFLKIADGCNNCCTYCAIPRIRGRYRSELKSEIVNEAKRLINTYGTQEFIIVAQDVTRYGSDRGELELMNLLDELEKLELYKLRLMYCYPELVTKALIDRIAAGGKIAKYIDMPMQHIDDKILTRMNRRSCEKELRATMDYIKGKDVAVRSTFIVGFPTEGESEFDKLCSFLSEYRIDNAGFFAYSREEGTAAYKMGEQVPYAVKRKRLQSAIALQSSIMANDADKLIGKTVEVTYDGIDYNKQCFFGHSEYNHPEIDKKAYFKSDYPLDIGSRYKIRITNRVKLDLKGRVEALK